MSLLKAFLDDAIAGNLEPTAMDEEATITAVFALANQINERHPGTAEKYGWARLDDLQTFAKAVLGATQATAPEGLK
jgi:hypothetical protein